VDAPPNYNQDCAGGLNPEFVAPTYEQPPDYVNVGVPMLELETVEANPARPPPLYAGGQGNTTGTVSPSHTVGPDAPSEPVVTMGVAVPKEEWQNMPDLPNKIDEY
jgi:hypothetical protein